MGNMLIDLLEELVFKYHSTHNLCSLSDVNIDMANIWRDIGFFSSVGN